MDDDTGNFIASGSVFLEPVAYLESDFKSKFGLAAPERAVAGRGKDCSLFRIQVRRYFAWYRAVFAFMAHMGV